jgi:hypothetical protein
MKNLLKQFKQNGRTLTLSLILLLLITIAGFVGYMASVSHAANEKYATRTFILPYKGETYKTIVLEDRATANMINGSTGASAAATTWASAIIAGTRHSVSGNWLFPIPAHSVNYIVLKRYDVSYNDATLTKELVSGNEPLLYNPNSGLAYTDTNPIMDNQVNVTTVTPSGG